MTMTWKGDIEMWQRKQRLACEVCGIDLNLSVRVFGPNASVPEPLASCDICSKNARFRKIEKRQKLVGALKRGRAGAAAEQPPPEESPAEVSKNLADEARASAPPPPAKYAGEAEQAFSVPD